MRLQDVIQTLGTGTVTIRGHELPIRAIPESETAAVHGQIPEPRLRESLIGNTNKTRIDFHHPQYRIDWDRVNRYRGLLYAAIALGHDGPDGPWRSTLTTEQAIRLAEDIASVLTRPEVDAIGKALAGLAGGEPPGTDERERIGTDTDAGN